MTCGIWHLKLETKLSFLTTIEMTHPTQLLYDIKSFCWPPGSYDLASHLSPYHLGADASSLNPVLSPGNRPHLYDHTACWWNQSVVEILPAECFLMSGSHLELLLNQAPANKVIYKASHVRTLLKGTINVGPLLKKGLTKHRSLCCHLLSWPQK